MTITIEKLEPVLPYLGYNIRNGYCNDKLHKHFNSNCSNCIFGDGEWCSLDQQKDQVYHLLKQHYPELVI